MKGFFKKMEYRFIMLVIDFLTAFVTELSNKRMAAGATYMVSFQGLKGLHFSKIEALFNLNNKCLYNLCTFNEFNLPPNLVAL
jgi:hypothetical protein